MTPWTAACQASLSFTISLSLLKLMSTELMMPSNHLILCHPLLHLPSIFPSIRVFSNELGLIGSCGILLLSGYTSRFIISCFLAQFLCNLRTRAIWHLFTDGLSVIRTSGCKEESKKMVKRQGGLSGGRDRLDRFQCYIENR